MKRLIPILALFGLLLSAIPRGAMAIDSFIPVVTPSEPGYSRIASATVVSPTSTSQGNNTLFAFSFPGTMQGGAGVGGYFNLDSNSATNFISIPINVSRAKSVSVQLIGHTTDADTVEYDVSDAIESASFGYYLTGKPDNTPNNDSNYVPLMPASTNDPNTLSSYRYATLYNKFNLAGNDTLDPSIATDTRMATYGILNFDVEGYSYIKLWAPTTANSTNLTGRIETAIISVRREDSVNN